MAQDQRLEAYRCVNGIHLLEVSMAAGLEVPKSSFPNCSFQLVLAGGYLEPSAGMERRCGSVHFHPAGDHQDAKVTRSSHIFGICIPGERMEIADRLGGCPSEPSDLTQPPIVDCMRRLHTESRKSDSASQLTIEGITCELLGHFARARIEEPRRTSPPKWLRVAFDTVASDPSRAWSLSEVAAECAVHPSHLAREFRKHFGCSVGEVARRAQVDLALRLLGTTDLPLTEVADRAGFYDASHLSRLVKERTGSSPGRLRS